MTYLKATKYLTLLLCLSFNALAELKPYTAIYDVYSRGSHVGESTHSLSKRDDNWLMTQHTEAQGFFASLAQPNPIIQEHLFKVVNQQAILLYARGDMGKSDEKDISSAYNHEETSQLFLTRGHAAKIIQTHQPVLSLLGLANTLHQLQSQMPKELALYQKGQLKQKTITYLSMLQGLNAFEVKQKGSNKTLRYFFKADNTHIPFRIEKIKKGKLKAHLELKHFK